MSEDNSMPYTYILIDSHPIDRLNCQQLIQKFEDFRCLEEFSNAIDALAYIKSHKVDFVVISKKLPVYDGFDFIKQLQQKPEIILLTNAASDALLAYEYAVFDCLLKPLSPKRFETALQRLFQHLQLKEQAHQVKAPKITIKSNLQTFHLDCTKILWIEATGDYIKIVLPKKTHLVHSSLKKFKAELPCDFFVQIHKSYLVNLNQIRAVEANQVWIQNKNLPLSRRRKPEFIERFNQLA